ncbi:prepilin-type N-terminal cleavage/methylation domain-containing protein [bacterium]|nr:prepilin-type N-terminal cleavage/methylation domain-containing protein [bacterium]
MLFRFKRKDSGFTIIEILVVVIIAAILAAVTIPMYIQYTESAKASDAKAAITSIYNSAKMYRQDYKEDPISISRLEELSYLELEENIKLLWEFRMFGLNPIFKISAISTSAMKGGAGKEIQYDVKSGEFTGYGFPSD